jgi:hypothetical protein
VSTSAAPGSVDERWSQGDCGQLIDAPRDCRHASSLDPPRDPGFLHLVLRHADVLAEYNGWPPRTLQPVRRGLRMIASCHEPGEPVRARTVTAMSSHGIPGLRVLEVLFAAGEDLVVDDRTDSLAVWIDAKFASLPPRMRDELDAWIAVLRHGTPRRRAQPRITAFTLLAAAHPFPRRGRRPLQHSSAGHAPRRARLARDRKHWGLRCSRPA